MARRYQISVIAKGDVSSAVTGLKRVERSSHGVAGAAGRATGPIKKLAGTMIGLGAAYIGYNAAKSAISTTVELGRASSNLSRNFGLNTKAAGEWAAMAKVNNIDGKALSTTFTMLSKNAEKASHGAKAQAAAFKAVGVSQKLLKSGDTNAILEQAAEGWSKLPGGTAKAAAGMAIFGKQWQTLVPIMKDGREGIRAQREEAEKYGAAVGDTTSVKEFVKAQHEAEYATLGLKVAFGRELVPIMTKAIHTFTKFIGAANDSKGAGQAFRQAYKKVGDTLKTVGGFLTHHSTITRRLVTGVIALTAAVKVYQVTAKAVKAVQIAWSLATGLATAAQIALNVALTANPIGLVVVAIGALAIGMAVAYRKVGWFHKAVDAVFGFLKKHWQLVGSILLGPVFLGVSMIIRHWSTLKRVTMAAISFVVKFVRKHWRAIIAVLTGPLGIAVALVVKHWSTIKSSASSALSFVTTKVGALGSSLASLPGKALTAGQNMAKNIKNGFLNAFKNGGAWIADASKQFANAVAKLLNQAIPNSLSLPEPFGSVNLPDNPIPAFARGGIVTRSTLGIIGEAGPEAIVPLGTSSQAIAHRSRVMQAAGLTGGGDSIHITINAGQATIDNPHALAERVAFALRTKRLGSRGR